MGWQLVTAKTQKITMPLAKSFADMEPAPGDRRLSENRLRVYERILRQGNWRPCVWSKATCEETGGVYRVNGKHTSVLFSRLAEEFPDCVVTVETYQCPTLEDVGRLYGTFDASITARTTRDINRAFSSTVAELADIPDRVIDICVTGIAVVTGGASPLFLRKNAPRRSWIIRSSCCGSRACYRPARRIATCCGLVLARRCSPPGRSANGTQRRFGRPSATRRAKHRSALIACFRSGC